jgi:DNA replication ATP-dependent helicase Dna2
VRNLWRWLSTEPRLRALVRGEAPPALAADDEDLTIDGFNPEQKLAVRRALAARDFLLIQGPPGTGKTRVVAEIVRQLAARGRRVLVAAFTNQAVDNVLTRLAVDGFHDFVRLGHELSVAPALRRYRLAARAEAAHRAEGMAAPVDSGDGHGVEPERMRAALVSAPVVASTTATWSAERYDEGGPALEFDVAVVDEASQLTVPALLGALRFARRFVLVGDERQLPPLVVSAEAAAGGLARSLFAQLHERWGERASVRLVRQYRMHPAICAFPSQEFYGGQLVTDGPAQTALLALEPHPSDGMEAVLAPERPLVFVDVPAGVASANAKSSQAQAHVVRRLVLGLRQRGAAAEHIGVIAPFRAQVAAIRTLLAASGELGVTVDTVDRFQGGEREAIVLA